MGGGGGGGSFHDPLQNLLAARMEDIQYLVLILMPYMMVAYGFTYTYPDSKAEKKNKLFKVTWKNK